MHFLSRCRTKINKKQTITRQALQTHELFINLKVEQINSVYAETPNHSGNNFRHARKHQTLCGMICGKPTSAKSFKKWFAGGPQAPKPFKNDLREARKHQTIRETTFAMRGNTKPFGKWLLPSAEISNHSGNNFRYARKCQTIREETFATRGNSKPFGKRLSPSAETPNHSGNDFRQARKRQTFCGMICGRPAKYINKKSTLKK